MYYLNNMKKCTVCKSTRDDDNFEENKRTCNICRQRNKENYLKLKGNKKFAPQNDILKQVKEEEYEDEEVKPKEENMWYYIAGAGGLVLLFLMGQSPPTPKFY
jgi:hypothetical protein